MTQTKRMRSAMNSADTGLIIAKSDTRNYRFVTLPNGIEAVLVRIPEGQSSKAAVSVAVNAGSMSEPDEFGGLAHFVEHCVFLGNKKYPNRNSLDKLLSKHNGYSNAHTELEYTAFYLEVNREGLSKALDIFSAAFDGPLFDVDLSCAELEAVDSEFHEIVTNDDCRIEHMLCHMAHSGHPYKKFTWGNKNSLLSPSRTKEQLVDKAREFFHSHYTPNRMKLSIVSSYSLDKMEKMLRDNFSVIAPTKPSSVPISGESTDCPLLDPSIHTSLAAQLPVTLAIKPITDINQLILLFPMPPIVDTYREKPADYLSHLIGHEGEGSLIEVLRSQSLATDISAGVGSDGYSNNSGLSIFEIKLTLTDQGCLEWRKLLSNFIFPYIQKLSIDESVFLEMKSIGEFQFHYTSEDASKDPIDTAEELSTSLLDTMKVDRSDILIYDHLYKKFDAKLIEKYYSFLKRENCLSMIVSKNLGGVGFDGEKLLVEPIFGIEYMILDNFEISLDEQNILDYAKFIIPPNPNQFVPSIDDLNSIIMTTERTENKFVVPKVVLESRNSNELIRLFHFTETRCVASPKMDVRIRFNFFEQGDFLNKFLALQVWVGYVTDLLEAPLYTAKLVGYRVSLAATTIGLGHESSLGIELVVNGYYGKIFQVINLIVTALGLNETGWQVERLERVMETIERNFKNEEVHPATNQAVSIRRNVISEHSFYRSADKLERLSLREVSYPDRGKPCSVDVMVVGEALDVVPQLRGLLEKIEYEKSSPVDCGSEKIVCRIEKEIVVAEPSLNPEEHTTVVILYYQFSEKFCVESAAMSEVIADLMSEPFFDSLRTEEQLGYSVQCGSRYTNGSVGFEFMIQSSNESGDNLVSRIEKFISNYYEKEIAPMSDEEFTDQLEALLETLLEPPASLAAEAKELWSEITENRLMWNYNDQICEEIDKKFLKNRKLIRKIIQDNFVSPHRVIVKVNGHIDK